MNKGPNDVPKCRRATKTQRNLKLQNKKKRRAQIHSGGILVSRILEVVVLKFAGRNEV